MLNKIIKKTIKEEATYILQDSQRERQRLQEQDKILKPFTVNLFNSAGIREGMRVLDVGCGPGDVAFTLAEMVGPLGSIVGMDINPDILNTAKERTKAKGFDNIDFVAGDMRNIELEGEFDAIVGRAVLVFTNQSEEVLDHLVQYLKPGGIMAFLEIDFSNGFVSTPSFPLFEQVSGWVLETCKRAGIDMGLGMSLRRLFENVGLEPQQLQYDAILGGGADWQGYAYAENTIRSMQTFMEALDVAKADEIDIDTLANRLKKNALSINATLMLTAWLGAWAKKPSSTQL